MIKEASVAAENVFADFEAVIPENFSRENTKTGHGEMAEEALTLLDKLQGRDAEVVGRTNEKNGADRVGCRKAQARVQLQGGPHGRQAYF